MVDDPLSGARSIATDPDRDPPTRRRRARNDLVDAVTTGHPFDRTVGPQPPECVERSIEAGVAFVERDVERRELASEIAHTDAKGEPTTSQRVERCGRLCQHEWVAVRQGDKVGQQANLRIGERHRCQRNKRIKRVVTTPPEPPAGRGRMVGDEDVVEPAGSRSPSDRRDRVGRLNPLRHWMRADWDPEAESHLSDDRARGVPAEHRYRPRHVG